MKGSVEDIIVYAILLFAFTFPTLIGYYVLNQMSTATSSQFTPAAQSLMTKGLNTVGLFNWGFLFLTIGFGVATIVGAFYIRTHPIFFVFSLITLSIFVLVGSIFSNVFWQFINTAQFVTLQTQFNIMIEIMKNLPYFILGIGFLTLIVMYAKTKSSGGSSEGI